MYNRGGLGIHNYQTYSIACSYLVIRECFLSQKSPFHVNIWEYLGWVGGGGGGWGGGSLEKVSRVWIHNYQTYSIACSYLVIRKCFLSQKSPFHVNIWEYLGWVGGGGGGWGGGSLEKVSRVWIHNYQTYSIACSYLVIRKCFLSQKSPFHVNIWEQISKQSLCHCQWYPDSDIYNEIFVNVNI